MSDVASQLSEQNRRREEAMHSLESLMRNKDHSSETEKIKLQSKITETVEEVSKKILQKEIKLREEAQSRYQQMEQVFSFDVNCSRYY